MSKDRIKYHKKQWVIKMVFIELICPFCGTSNIRKYGKDRFGKQRYECLNNDCKNRTFVENYSYNGYSPDVKNKIITMTLNGSGIRDISRVLEISPVTVLNELKKKKI